MRSGQNHLAKHSDGGKKTRQTEEEVGRQHQGMGRRGGREVGGWGGGWGQWRTEKCRKLVVQSSVVPQRPSRLRDR